MSSKANRMRKNIILNDVEATKNKLEQLIIKYSYYKNDEEGKPHLYVDMNKVIEETKKWKK